MRRRHTVSRRIPHQIPLGPLPEGHSIYCPGLPTPSKLRTISQTIETWRTHLVTYAHCLIFTPSERIDEMAKFVALANYNEIPGNFDLDVTTGEVRYRLFFDCAGFDTLPSTYLKCHLPILMLPQYGDAIFSNANGTSAAESALARAKADESTPVQPPTIHSNPRKS